MNWLKPNIKLPSVTPPSVSTIKKPAGPVNPANMYDPFGDLKDKMNGGGNLGMGDFVTSMPGYSSIIGQNGNLDPRYTFTPGGAGYDGIKGIATSKGPTDLYNAQVGLIDQTTKGQFDSLRRDSAIGVGTGMGTLAATGGLDSGARERVAASGQRALMEGGSGILQGAALAKGQAGVADAGMKYDAMGRVMGVDNYAQTFNIGNSIDDLRGRDAFAMGTWGKLGDIYGTGMVADAMGGGGGGGKGGIGGNGGVASGWGERMDPSKWMSPDFYRGTPSMPAGDGAKWYDPRNMTMNSGGGNGGSVNTNPDPRTWSSNW